MNKELDRILEEPETWDYEQAKVRKPVKAPRVVVSVAFRRDEFGRVSEHAERIGKRTSEFIREAALEKATGKGKPVAYGSGGSGPVVWFWLREYMPPVTRVVGMLKEEPRELAARTS